MSVQTGRVVVLEINEITWDLMDPLLRRGALPNFRSMMEQGAYGDAWASEEPDHLDPWVTWTTLYTGVPQSVHRLSMLEQNKETLGAKRFWEYLQESGLRIGLFGTANSWPPERVDGFWIPGPFSCDFATFPSTLEPIQQLNVGLTRGHTTGGGKRPRMAALLPKLLRLGLAPSTLILLARQMVAMKRNPDTKWKLIALQPLVNLDMFAHLYRRYQPHFATLHTNHVAYYQHRFWRAMDPEAFDVSPSEEERERYSGCIEHGYRVADQMLGGLRRIVGPNVNLVVLSSCGQQPATGGKYSDDQRQGNLGLQLRIEKLLDLLGIVGRVQYSNLMAPEWKLDFDDRELLQQTLIRLKQGRNVTRNVNVFSAYPVENSLCIAANRRQQMEDTLELPTPGGVRSLPAKDLLRRHAEVVKSGRHHPKGVLLMQGPDIRAGSVIDRCDNLDIAPTLMRLLGQRVPPAMQGRVLEEALTASAHSVRQEPIAVS